MTKRNLTIKAQDYKRQLELDHNYGGTERGIHEENMLFFILEQSFEYSLEAEENVEAMQYCNRATDIERANYILEVIIPNLK